MGTAAGLTSEFDGDMDRGGVGDGDGDGEGDVEREWELFAPPNRVERLLKLREFREVNGGCNVDEEEYLGELPKCELEGIRVRLVWSVIGCECLYPTIIGIETDGNFTVEDDADPDC
jgi:hypothetical protein